MTRAPMVQQTIYENEAQWEQVRGLVSQVKSQRCCQMGLAMVPMIVQAAFAAQVSMRLFVKMSSQSWSMV
jgi:hypothetical protein